MFKKIISLMCVLSIFIASGASAYKRDVVTTLPTRQDETQNPEPDQSQPPGKQQTSNEDPYKYSSGGSGTLVGGYILLGVGGAAAITGSALIAANKKRTTGIIIASAGGVMSLAGSLMVLLGSRSYAVAPMVDPAHGTYGLSLAKNF